MQFVTHTTHRLGTITNPPHSKTYKTKYSWTPAFLYAGNVACTCHIYLHTPFTPEFINSKTSVMKEDNTFF